MQYDDLREPSILGIPALRGSEYSGFSPPAPTDTGAQPMPRFRPSAADRLEPAAVTQALLEPPEPGRWERFTGGRWPLLVILLGQLVLSLHLLWANTAYQDEALYLLSGHLEWSHWLHGTPIPQFQTYFSGSPVIYPPIGAAADALGGLAAARALSLCFMLGATTALHGVTKRIFGRNPAAFAAALFAGVGATQYLGAFATYDAMALSLLALATWLGVRATVAMRYRDALLVLSGLAVVLADAAKYAAALFDPVVIGVAVLFAWQRRGRRDALTTGLIMSATITLTLAAALAAGGRGYWQGINFTTLTRAPSDSPPAAIFLVSLGWAGAVAALAAIGAMTLRYRDRGYTALGLTLAVAVWLVPAEQARIYTFTSLFKHVGFGEWFGAIAGGVALASITAAVPRIKAEGALRASWAVVVTSTVFGFMLAANQFSSWPNASALVSVLRPLLKDNQHSVLAADNGNVIAYYLTQNEQVSKEYFIDSQGQWQGGFNGTGFSYKNSRTGKTTIGLSAYYLAVKNGYFTVITLSNYSRWLSADNTIRHDILINKDYRLVASIPYTASGEKNIYQVWVHKGVQ
jgi:hypothetical protein